MQLTDEPDKRCYPLDSHLLCRSCHISHLNENTPELEVKYYYSEIVGYTYYLINMIFFRVFQLHTNI